jgi:hypothetical protein
VSSCGSVLVIQRSTTPRCSTRGVIPPWMVIRASAASCSGSRHGRRAVGAPTRCRRA